MMMPPAPRAAFAATLTGPFAVDTAAPVVPDGGDAFLALLGDGPADLDLGFFADLFDSKLGEANGTMSLLDDYTVPPYFSEDLFALAGERRRPPYRWFIMGPERSGSGIHTDPLATSAWNMLVAGHKRWCVFPPGVRGSDVKPRSGEDNEAVTWFTKVMPRTAHLERYDFIQRPGETVYIPGNWWHVVLNLDETIAVTQNFTSSTNFAQVWDKTSRSRPKLSVKWLAALDEQRPDLAQLARQQLSACKVCRGQPSWEKHEKHKHHTPRDATKRALAETDTRARGGKQARR